MYSVFCIKTWVIASRSIHSIRIHDYTSNTRAAAPPPPPPPPPATEALSMETSSSGSRDASKDARVAAVVRRHYSQLALRKGKRRRHAAGRRRPGESAVRHGEHAAPGEGLLLSAQKGDLPEIQNQSSGRSSAVFEQWWPSPVVSPTDRTSVVVRKARCTSPLLSLLHRYENLRGHVFERCSLGVLHRLCLVCAILREFSLEYMRERVHRPVVFGGMRRGRWRLADGASSSFSDTCCAEEFFWGGSAAWVPVPSLYSRLRLSEPPSNTEGGDGATVAWMGAAAAFGEWPSTACIDAVRQYTAELRGYAVAYAQLCRDPIGSDEDNACPHIVIAGGVHVGDSAGSHSRPVAKAVAVCLTCGALQYLPDMETPRANFSLSVYPPPARSRHPRSSAISWKRFHEKAVQERTGTGTSMRLVILVAVGGVGELQEPLASAEMFCCSTDGTGTSSSKTRSASWMELPPMQTARTHPSATCWCWPAGNGCCSNLFKVAVVVVGGLSTLGSVLRSTETLSVCLATTATYIDNEAGRVASPCAGTTLEDRTLPAVPKASHRCLDSSWVRGPALTTGRFGACVVLVQRRRGECAYGLTRKGRQHQHERHDDRTDAATDSGVSEGVMDVLVAGGYSLSSGKLSSVELLDDQAPSPAASKCRLERRGLSGTHGSGNGGGGAFLQLAQLSVARSPWSHSSEGVEGASNPIAEASSGGASGGSALVFGITLAGVAGRQGNVKTTPFKSPAQLK